MKATLLGSVTAGYPQYSAISAINFAKKLLYRITHRVASSRTR